MIPKIYKYYQFYYCIFFRNDIQWHQLKNSDSLKAQDKKFNFFDSTNISVTKIEITNKKINLKTISIFLNKFLKMKRIIGKQNKIAFLQIVTKYVKEAYSVNLSQNTPFSPEKEIG